MCSIGFDRKDIDDDAVAVLTSDGIQVDLEGPDQQGVKATRSELLGRPGCQLPVNTSSGVKSDSESRQEGRKFSPGCRLAGKLEKAEAGVCESGESKKTDNGRCGKEKISLFMRSYLRFYLSGS